MVDQTRDALWLMLGWPGGFHHITRTYDGQRVRSFVPVGSRRIFVGACANDDCSVSVAPHPEANGWSAMSASVLWARVESKRAEGALRFFKPRPTLVVREGGSCRHVAVWALSDVLDQRWVVELNRRVAHRLGAAKKHCGLEFEMPAPGTVLRAGREARPVLVHVAEFRDDAVYGAREVGGWLPVSPDPDAWRERAA